MSRKVEIKRSVVHRPNLSLRERFNPRGPLDLGPISLQEGIEAILEADHARRQVGAVQDQRSPRGIVRAETSWEIAMLLGVAAPQVRCKNADRCCAAAITSLCA